MQMKHWLRMQKNMHVHIVEEALPAGALTAVVKDAYALADCKNFWVPKVSTNSAATLLIPSCTRGCVSEESWQDHTGLLLLYPAWLLLLAPPDILPAAVAIDVSGDFGAGAYTSRSIRVFNTS